MQEIVYLSLIHQQLYLVSLLTMADQMLKY